MARVACMLVADFSIAALVRADPDLEGAVLAVASSLAPHAELDAVAPRARALGIRPGMTIAQARAVSSALLVSARSEAAEHSAHDALADAAESISPVVEPGAPGCVWLDLAGLERLHASEHEIASELARRAGRVGMQAAVGVAANKEIAHLAACCGGIRVIEPGREREFLDWLPLDRLALDTPARASGGAVDMAGTLARWGLRRLGDLARLDTDAIGSRLGRRGVELVRLARGGDAQPLAARARAEVFAEAIELDYGCESLEALGFVVRAMLERLVERLALRGLAAGDLLLTLGLEGHRVASRRVTVAAPSVDARAMLTLVNLALEAEPPDAPVESVRIEATPRAIRPAQADMFLPPTPAPDRLAATIARLAALCGPQNVGALAAENSHRPDAVRLERFEPPAPSARNGGGASAPALAARLMLRAIRPAREIEVLCSRAGPRFVRGENLGARVVSIAGPWRRDGEWWKSAPQSRSSSGGDPAGAGFARDYFELALDDGGVYRVFRDLKSERWFLDGVYD
jgi:protein ImuB